MTDPSKWSFPSVDYVQAYACVDVDNPKMLDNACINERRRQATQIWLQIT